MTNTAIIVNLALSVGVSALVGGAAFLIPFRLDRPSPRPVPGSVAPFVRHAVARNENGAEQSAHVSGVTRDREHRLSPSQV